MFISTVTLGLSKLIKRKNHYIAFGAWLGELYADNSKYLMEYMLSALGDDYRFIWIGRKNIASSLPKDHRIVFKEINSWNSVIWLLQCKYMFCSQHLYNDLCKHNVYHGAIITYLHHGFPIKRWGNDAIHTTNRNHENSLLYRRYQKILPFKLCYDYFVVSSQTQGEHFLTSLSDRGCIEEKILYTGTPRNDFLINSNNNTTISLLKKKYSALFGFQNDKRIILYLPTYRRVHNHTESLFLRDVKEEYAINRLLEDYNAILIEKKHFVEQNNGLYMHDILKRGNCYAVKKKVDTQELLMISDILISDYSGAFVDYLLLDRPIIHYIYDYETYKNEDSGLYYDIEDFSSGETVTRFQDLMSSLQKVLSDEDDYQLIRSRRRAFFMEDETGKASENITKLVIEQKGEKK